MSPTIGRLRFTTLAAIILLLCSTGCKKTRAPSRLLNLTHLTRH